MNRQQQCANAVWQAILPVRMGLRPMKGDESLAEVRLSLTSFDAWTVRRVADRVNRKGEAFDRAGGLSGRRFRYATNFSGFAAGCLRTRSRRNTCELREWSSGGLKGRLQARLPATQGGRQHVTKEPKPSSRAKPAPYIANLPWYIRSFTRNSVSRFGNGSPGKYRRKMTLLSVDCASRGKTSRRTGSASVGGKWPIIL